MAIQTLIYDFDDTIVRSEDINTFLIADHFQEVLGIDLTDEDKEIVYGHGWTYIFNYMIGKYSLDTTKENVQQGVLVRKKKYLQENNLQLAQGFENMLSLPVKHLIVSGSSRDEIDMMFENIGLSTNAFHGIFSIDDYKKSKPEPHGFTMALESLDIKADKAIVFEDSRSGILGANNAGIKAVFVREFANKDYSEMAEHSFDTFIEVYGWIEPLIAK
ncbi:HAD family hydrolase [Spirochaetota bacterium]